MKRRDSIAAIAALCAVPYAMAQPAPKAARIAVLDELRKEDRAHLWKIFFDRLGALGYTEGKNLVLDRRWAGGNLEKLPALAREIVAMKPDVIVASGSPASFATKNATTQIPIVSIAATDPVDSGLVANLARPGGNMTGAVAIGLAGKWIELLREIAPKAKSVGYLLDRANQGSMQQLLRLQEVAKPLGMSVTSLDGHDQESVERSFRTIAQERIDGLIVSAAILARMPQIVTSAAQRRVTVIYPRREFVQAGGLIALESDREELNLRAAEQVHKILQGAKPSDLPFQQSTKIFLVVNQRAAKAAGIKIPQVILLRADQVID